MPMSLFICLFHLFGTLSKISSFSNISFELVDLKKVFGNIHEITFIATRIKILDVIYYLGFIIKKRTRAMY